MFQQTLIATLALALSGTACGYQARNGRILDAAGNTLQLRGVNWFGFDTPTHVVHGLWMRNWKDQIQQMQDLGFNAVRLPFCPTTLYGAPPNSIDYALNPDLSGLNGLQVMDKVVRELSDRGLRILLDHHSPDCATISELWYTPAYPEAQWIGDLEFVAARFAGIPGVIGIDLKNEPHGAATWGTGQQATDWNLAAGRAATRVLARAPHWLVFVEGIADTAYCSSPYGHGWGGNLEPLRCAPLDIPADRLVLAPHAYGPDVYSQAYFNDPFFPANMPAIWEQHFGQFTRAGYPVVLGEFGGKFGTGSAGDRPWQQAMVNYLIGKGMTDSFYWSWNPNSSDTGGILQDDWTNVRTDKMALLRTLWAAGSTPATTTPAPAPAAGTTAQFATRVTTDSDWGAGFCQHVDITNTGATAGNWTASIPVAGRIDNLWNATWTQSGTNLQAAGYGWNATLAPGATAQFGFCAIR